MKGVKKMKEKIKGLFNAVVKPVLLGFVAIILIVVVLSIPELAGALCGIAGAWVFGKLIMFGYELYKEEKESAW